jgi:hypothetical protein
MAATYSAFMTTRFYSPVFNTALFDGPFRIYFSQSYESSALKIYHLMQTQNEELWIHLKKWSSETHEHVFILMYPEVSDVKMIFQKQKNDLVEFEVWDEGIAIGMTQPQDESEASAQILQIEKILANWIKNQKAFELTL